MCAEKLLDPSQAVQPLGVKEFASQTGRQGLHGGRIKTQRR